MGEYAKYLGERVKIGTCEDMYYLRLSQRAAVVPEDGNVDPVSDAGDLRFRFPWPDEDGTEPGAYGAGYKAVAIYGATAPKEVVHGNVQFVTQAGYNICLPCPEGTHNPDIHRNSFSGAVQLISQRLIDGRVIPIFQCGGCKRMWRIEDPAEIEEIRAIIIATADDEDRRHRAMPEQHRATVSRGDWWRKVAERLDKES